MSINKVILVGNLGKDPSLAYTASGTAVCNFTVATSERWKDKSGEQQEVVTWHNIVAWAKLAEICAKYLQKGKQVYIEGRIQTRSYDDKSGVKKYTTEIVADQMKMLGSSGSVSRENANMPGNGRQDEETAFNIDDEIPF